VEGAYLSCTCVLATASEDEQVQKFIDDYKAAYNTLPATYSSEGFDAATAFINGVKAGSTSKEDLNTYVDGVDFTGVSKPIEFEDNGELAGGSTYIHIVKDGAIVNLGDYQDAPTG
jgi:branched-chain amino acid transport system substrate-binding protein